MTQSTTPIPAAPVLSYLANISTPTRVRLLAARIVKIIGLLHLLLALVILVLAALGIWKDAQEYARLRGWGAFGFGGWIPGPPRVAISFDDVVRATRDNLGALFLLPFTLTPATALLLLTRPLRQGRRVASILVSCYFIPISILLFVSLPFVASVCLVVGLGIHGHAERGQLLWLVAIPPGILLVLFLKDLCAFLLWIARNPMVDKPPVTFLPAKPGETTPAAPRSH